MEEDIKIIQEKLEIIESLCTDDCINKSTVIQPLKYAIQNLISRYKELEKEYKVLREYVNFAPNLDEMSATKYKEIRQSAYIEGRQDEINRAKEFIEETCIPKSKVQEKIEEIQNRKTEDGECELALHGFQREAKIQVLQELLED